MDEPTLDPVVSVPSQRDYIAPDGSEVRLLSSSSLGGMAHCTLLAGQTSLALRHASVEELWYVVSGEGLIWRSRDRVERVDRLSPGVSVRVGPGVSFQVRAVADLELLITTMPPWPGPSEAVLEEGPW